MPDISTKQRRFAYTLIHTGNIEHAAKAAEISLELAREWERDPDVEAVITHDKVAALNTAMETRERVIARYANIANNNPGDFFVGGEAGWQLKAVGDLTDDQLRCIKKITRNQWGESVEFYPADRANDKLAEILRVIADDMRSESAEEKASQIRRLLQDMEDATTGVTTH